MVIGDDYIIGANLFRTKRVFCLTGWGLLRRQRCCDRAKAKEGHYEPHLMTHEMNMCSLYKKVCCDGTNGH